MEEKPLVILVAGLPLVGKSAIAKRISEELAIRHIDIDDTIGFPILGLPDPNPYRSQEKREKIKQRMGMCYELLIHSIEANIVLGHHIITTATFSNLRARENIRSMMIKYPQTSLKVIWCRYTRDNETEEAAEIARRLEKRKFGENYTGGCNSVEHYLDDKRRYTPMNLPHLELDTFPPHMIEECVTRALQYILID